MVITVYVIVVLIFLLNQRIARFLEIALSGKLVHVCMYIRMYVCVSALRVLITIHVK